MCPVPLLLFCPSSVWREVYTEMRKRKEKKKNVVRFPSRPINRSYKEDPDSRRRPLVLDSFYPTQTRVFRIASCRRRTTWRRMTAHSAFCQYASAKEMRSLRFSALPDRDSVPAVVSIQSSSSRPNIPLPHFYSDRQRPKEALSIVGEAWGKGFGNWESSF